MCSLRLKFSSETGWDTATTVSSVNKVETGHLDVVCILEKRSPKNTFVKKGVVFYKKKKVFTWTTRLVEPKTETQVLNSHLPLQLYTKI